MLKKMKSLGLCLSFFFVSLLNFNILANEYNLKKININTVKSIFSKNKINIENMGIYIEWPNGYKITNLENKLFIPASITKLLTTLAVVKNYPNGLKFKTELYYDNKNLYLKGGGDPSFVSENLWFLVNEFKRQGISEIAGDIIIDDSLFDKIRYDESRESVRVDRSYDSPVGAMSFNWNSINIFVKPSVEINEKAVVILDPENQYFKLINNTKTVDKVKKEIIVDVKQNEKIIVVSGEVKFGENEKAIYKNVSFPDLWSGENLKSFLLQRNIQVKGTVKTGSLPENVRKVATYESKSTASILADMNKFSNNFVAEMLTKNLSVINGVIPATLDEGVKIINKTILQLGASEKDFKIINPSGFTRENKITPYVMNLVLKEIENDFRYFSPVLESLPIAGVDGTMRKRLKNSSGESFVRAKTGYLDGVITLSGYVGLKNGEIVRINFLYNGPQDETKVRQTVDQVLLAILE